MFEYNGILFLGVFKEVKKEVGLSCDVFVIGEGKVVFVCGKNVV